MAYLAALDIEGSFSSRIPRMDFSYQPSEGIPRGDLKGNLQQGWDLDYGTWDTEHGTWDLGFGGLGGLGAWGFDVEDLQKMRCRDREGSPRLSRSVILSHGHSVYTYMLHIPCLQKK